MCQKYLILKYPIIKTFEMKIELLKFSFWFVKVLLK